MTELPHLFEPIRIGSLNLPNRIVMVPMGTCFATNEGMPTERMANYYAERAKGGAGLIIVEQTVVQPRGSWAPQAAGIWDDGFIPGWRMVVDAVHSCNGKIAIQLGHMGASTSAALVGEQPWGPSPLPDYLIGEIPHEMTLADIRQFKEDYIAGVERAVKAGFDAIEIHCSHGYLLASFMSGRTNRRTDEYGGTLEGRLRLPLEIIKEVRQAVGKDYPLLMRIASVEVNGGRLLEETKVIASALVEEGLDALDVSAGSYFELEWEVPPYFFSPGFNIANIEAIKRSINVPIIGAGRITEPRFAEQLLAEGRLDLVGIGRALIADPEWPEKAAAGDLEDIHRCIGCTRCLDFISTPMQSSDAGGLKCTVNPYVGREGQAQIGKADKPRKVLVVGGGPAGLYSAAVAAARGHNVTLWEKDDTLGGQVRIAAMVPQKHEIASVISWIQREAKGNGAKLQTGKTATRDNILAFKPDAVIVATGASPSLPDIPGINNASVVTAHDVLAGRATVGSKVLIIGGGALGCETAHYLATYDKSVTVLKRHEDFGQGLEFGVRPVLLKKLASYGVTMMPSTAVKEILQDGAVVEKGGTRETLKGYDSIVIATGSEANDELYHKIMDDIAEVHCIGDAREPAKTWEALNDAFELGLRV